MAQMHCQEEPTGFYRPSHRVNLPQCQRRGILDGVVTNTPRARASGLRLVWFPSWPLSIYRPSGTYASFSRLESWIPVISMPLGLSLQPTRMLFSLMSYAICQGEIECLWQRPRPEIGFGSRISTY